MVGHKEQIKTLVALADAGHLGHAYIFFGPSQVGKFTLASAFAAYLERGNFLNESTIALTDFRVFAPDERGKIGIDTSRQIHSFLMERPFISSRRVAVIDRAEFLTPEAENALLKIAEEPPESALLILIVPDPEILRPTLRSRFQEIYFPPVASPELEEWLQKTHKASSSKATKLALESFGKPGLALDLLTGQGEGRRLLAESFFKVPPSRRKDYIKELTAAEDFNFSYFLDSLIEYLAVTVSGNLRESKTTKHGKLWHAVIELRRTQDSTSLSPRIQLMNLWTLT